MRLTAAAGAAGLGLALVLGGCARVGVGPGPIVVHHVHDVRDGVLAKVAVVPFVPAPLLAPSAGPAGLGAAEAAELVTRIVAEALIDAGIETVAPSDLVIAFEGQGQVLPRRDATANARVAASEFGATAIVTGQVMRYREREGGAAGALAPASVHFELELHGAPDGGLLYTGRFDQTQRALSADVLLARQYPGGGTRWLTVAELPRWGAEEFLATLPEVMRPEALRP